MAGVGGTGGGAKGGVRRAPCIAQLLPALNTCSVPAAAPGSGCLPSVLERPDSPRLTVVGRPGPQRGTRQPAACTRKGGLACRMGSWVTSSFWAAADRRLLRALQVPSLVEGGALWFPDLTAADPLYLLPVLSSLTFLLTVELGAGDGMEGQVRIVLCFFGLGSCI